MSDLSAAALRTIRRARTQSLRNLSTARAGNRRFWRLSALRAHTKAPYKMDFHRKTLRALNRPKAARTVADLARPVAHAAVGDIRAGVGQHRRAVLVERAAEEVDAPDLGSHGSSAALAYLARTLCVVRCTTGRNKLSKTTCAED
jgi:hypothetical protein